MNKYSLFISVLLITNSIFGQTVTRDSLFNFDWKFHKGLSAARLILRLLQVKTVDLLLEEPAGTENILICHKRILQKSFILCLTECI
jgi:hypothetical protein